ncbi:MAG: response regulator [Hyphomicrobiaceae bacterium]|nr:response regulator [Hyphomicrobiaceae bacterium]
MHNRVLIVEDDTLQQALLGSALEQRGFAIDTAVNGIDGIRLLQRGHYDAAIFDYRLPDIDGLASARLARHLLDEGGCPSLIGMTADLDELEARDAETNAFDAHIAKPFELAAIVRLVEAAIMRPQASIPAHARWAEFGLSRAPRAIVLPMQGKQRHAFLAGLFDLTSCREPEIILLADASGVAAIEDVRRSGEGWYLPVADLTGRFGHLADVSFTGAAASEWMALAAAVTRFAERRRAVAGRVLKSRDFSTRLLGHIAMSGRPLTPGYDAHSTLCVSYSGFLPARGVISAAPRLEERGLLRRRFVDRFHVCPGCDSSRLSAREVCPSCRSSDLTSTAVIHHYRCAHQGLEAEFAAGRDLVCPKCRQHLRHYGSDYDRAGTALECGACRAVHAEPAVGFVCLDCSLVTDGDVIHTRDVFSYELTDEGYAAIAASAVGLAQELAADVPAEIPGDVPAEVADAVARWSAAAAASGNVVALAEIRYVDREACLEKRGQGAFERARRIFLSNVVGAAPASVDGFSGPTSDFVVANDGPETLRRALSADMLADAEDTLEASLKPEVRFIDIVA